MILYLRLQSDELEILVVVGLHFVGRWPRIQAHMMMMIALVEMWDSRYNTFHLPTGEAMVTLLDVWRILKIPVCGVIPEYHLDAVDFYLREVCKYEALLMLDRSRMHLCREMGIRHIPHLVLVICEFFSKLIIPDLGGHGFFVG